MMRIRRSGFWMHGMSFSASAAHSISDERVLEVQFTDDAISVSLRDRRVISVPLVWYPRLLDATAAQRNNWKNCRPRPRNLLAPISTRI